MTEATIRKEQFELVIARKKLYQLLHLLLSKPLTVETHEQIMGNGCLDAITNLGQGGLLLLEFFKAEKVEESIRIAREDYFRLFIGPHALLAPPWESVYRGKERALFDFPAFEVRKLYNQFGLSVENTENQHREADDHLVFELEYMLALIEKSLKEQEKDTLIALFVGQKTMIDEHLLKWIPQFSEDIRLHADSKLFTGVALLLDEFVSFESNILEEFICELNVKTHK